ncbi:MAG: ABC transporter permease subunit [Mycobacterium leprae]
MSIFRQFFLAQWKGLVIWAIGGALYSLATTNSAPSFINTNALAAMPPSLLKMMGDIGGLSPVDGYVALTIAKALTVVPVLYAVILALSVVTREVDKRTAEFLLALPVGRGQILAARAAVLGVNITTVVVVTWAALRFTLPAQGYQASWGPLGLVFVSVWLLSLACGAITLAASMWIDDYSVGIKLFLGLATVAFILDYVLKAAGVSRVWRLLSPFSYVSAADIMRTGSIATLDWLVPVLAVVVSLVVSFRAFSRKQFAA